MFSRAHKEFSSCLERKVDGPIVFSAHFSICEIGD
jgi:hypothetical protein